MDTGGSIAEIFKTGGKATVGGVCIFGIELQDKKFQGKLAVVGSLPEKCSPRDPGWGYARKSKRGCRLLQFHCGAMAPVSR